MNTYFSNFYFIFLEHLIKQENCFVFLSNDKSILHLNLITQGDTGPTTTAE